MLLDFLNHFHPTNVTIQIMNATNCPPPGTVFVERQVVSYEFDFITWGEGKIVTADKPYEAIGGRLFIRNPGLDVKGVASYYCYYLTFDLVDRLGNKYDKPLPFPDYIDFDDLTILEPFFEKLYSAFLTQGTTLSFVEETMISNIFLTLIDNQLHIDRESADTAIKDSTYIAVQKVKALIDKDPRKTYTLEYLADQSDLSVYHFSRVFRKQINEAPIAYMNRLKLLSVKRCLLATNNSAKSIMIEHGFKNESHFYNMFKQKVGMTPVEYRRTHQLTFI